MSMAWSEDLTIGVAQIDQQHRELFRRFDALLVACRQGPSIALLVETNQKVMAWLVDHIRKTDRALAAHLGEP